jgi:hypothetical protein
LETIKAKLQNHLKILKVMDGLKMIQIFIRKLHSLSIKISIIKNGIKIRFFQNNFKTKINILCLKIKNKMKLKINLRLNFSKNSQNK